MANFAYIAHPNGEEDLLGPFLDEAACADYVRRILTEDYPRISWPAGDPHPDWGSVAAHQILLSMASATAPRPANEHDPIAVGRRRGALACDAASDRTDPATNVADVLANLMHYADATDVDFESALAAAQGHHAAEVRGED